MEKYNPAVIEKKWQERWEKSGIFKVSAESDKKNYYMLEMFPYPSGRIHMGHVRNYTIGDAIARFKMMRGFDVLHPIGFDAFGMPAENAAIAHNIAPKKWTLENIEYMETELKRLGFSYDWSREVVTCLSEYYRWEQKIFIQMYKNGMAYRKNAATNFCNHCQTVLANEQVEDGRCWRCGSEVEKKQFSQWFFKITDYADQLLDDMAQIKEGWPEKVLTMQRHWIGKSYGSMVDFKIEGSDKYISVFTTRPDTLFGVTFVSIAPLHPDLPELIKSNSCEKAVKKFIEKNSAGTTSEAELAKREKEGVFTGIYLINPVNNKKVPLYAANFVVTDYGTGVVMGVPAHDQRDYEFAKKYDIPIKYVILPENNEIPKDCAYTGEGTLVDSGNFSGLNNIEAKDKITQFLEKRKLGKKVAQFRLRDWNVSRQRYWGAPIPVIYCDECGIVTVPEKDLPVVLPDDVKITGEGGSPLKNSKAFVNTVCPNCGKPAKRETDTFDTFVESSWYFLRYISPDENAPFNKNKANRWMPVDQYVGGIEHAVMHLLYARYFVKVLRDLGYIDCDEPFARLLTQGMVIKNGAKMSKSKGNVVDPDELIENYGADTARLFSLFAAPPEKDLEWSDEGVAGAHRFLGRVWNLLIGLSKKISLQESAEINSKNLSEKLKSFLTLVNKTINKVTKDMENYHFNTAISKLMELTNGLVKFDIVTKNDEIAAGFAASSLIRMLSPMAPHFAEELWEKFGKGGFVSKFEWPKYNQKQIFEDKVNIALTVNGKLRDQISVAKGLSEQELKQLAIDSPKVKRFTTGKTINKVIVVKDKIVNVVAV